MAILITICIIKIKWIRCHKNSLCQSMEHRHLKANMSFSTIQHQWIHIRLRILKLLKIWTKAKDQIKVVEKTINHRMSQLKINQKKKLQNQSEMIENYQITRQLQKLIRPQRLSYLNCTKIVKILKLLSTYWTISLWKSRSNTM